MADVLNMSSNTWFRTSDDEAPKVVSQIKVTSSYTESAKMNTKS